MKTHFLFEIGFRQVECLLNSELDFRSGIRKTMAFDVELRRKKYEIELMSTEEIM